jgi:hypothetical protein
MEAQPISSETAAAGITRKRPPGREHVIVARPNGRGRYDAIHTGEILVKSTSIPFLAGCRALLARGFDPNATAVMRHEGSTTDSLRGRIGKAAELTVSEATRDGKPRFATYHPFQDSEASVGGRPTVRSNAQGLPEGLEAAE